ncbi:MAG: ATP-binding cassette domain-containing protein [Ruminococcus sp.]
MSEPILEMKNISKNFGSVIALKNVDLEVYPGEIRGLIGENGSGKSTISSIAAGMQKATSGRMTFKSRVGNQ